MTNKSGGIQKKKKSGGIHNSYPQSKVTIAKLNSWRKVYFDTGDELYVLFFSFSNVSERKTLNKYNSLHKYSLHE